MGGTRTPRTNEKKTHLTGTYIRALVWEKKLRKKQDWTGGGASKMVLRREHEQLAKNELLGKRQRRNPGDSLGKKAEEKLLFGGTGKPLYF